MMKRLFIALDLPDFIVDGLCGMGATISGAKPTPPEQLHLTLKFIGEVDGAVAIDIRQALEEVAFPPFSMRLKGVGCFPPRKAPRVLWCGIEPREQVIRLRNRIENVLAANDVERENRKFSPHITLARLNNSPIGQLQTFLADNSLLMSPEFTIDEFILFESTLTRRGAIHTAIARYPLRGTGPATG